MIKDIVVNLALGGTRDGARDYASVRRPAFNAHLTGVGFSYEPFVPVNRSSIATPHLWPRNCALRTKRLRPRPPRNSMKSCGKTRCRANPGLLRQALPKARMFFARIARRHDISIVAQAKPQSEFPDDLIIEAALFNSGRPVLVIVPDIQSASLKLDRILVCWDGSRSAARAISDAMPFLERGKDIDTSRWRSTTTAAMKFRASTWPNIWHAII